MNKITNLANSTQVFNNNRVANSAKSENAFKDILSKAIEEKGISPSKINDVNNVQTLSLKTPEIKIAEKTNVLINMLDDYSKTLNDSSKSLRDIEPVINSIKEKASDLINETDKNLNMNRNLKDIATHCAMTANNEYLKFSRGDFV